MFDSIWGSVWLLFQDIKVRDNEDIRDQGENEIETKLCLIVVYNTRLIYLCIIFNYDRQDIIKYIKKLILPLICIIVKLTCFKKLLDIFKFILSFKINNFIITLVIKPWLDQ